MTTILNIETMSKEQKEAVLKKANNALLEYQQESRTGRCSAGYDILRYAKAGLYQTVGAKEDE